MAFVNDKSGEVHRNLWRRFASISMSDEYNEAEMIARLQAGDKTACAECIEIHSPLVYRLALRLMGKGRSGLGTWLYRIAYNAAMMRLRRTEPNVVSVDESLDGDGQFVVPRQLFDWCCLPETDFESDEVRDELETAIGELPESLRVVFMLRELEGLSTRETAEALEISEGAVKVRLHRARLWLREKLSPYFTGLAHEGGGVL